MPQKSDPTFSTLPFLDILAISQILGTPTNFRGPQESLGWGCILGLCCSCQKLQATPANHWASPGNGTGALLGGGGSLLTSLGCSCGSPWATLGHAVGKPLENNRTPDSSQASPPITRPRATECRAQQAPQTDRPPMLGPNAYGDLEIYTRMPSLRIFDWKMLMFAHSKSARRLKSSSSKGEAKNWTDF